MSRAWRPGGTAGAGIQALGECEWLPRHGQTAPEASHESRARAKIGARAGKRAADGEEGDFARSREQREAVARRSARLERAPADKEDRTRELGTEGQQQRVDGCFWEGVPQFWQVHKSLTPALGSVLEHKLKRYTNGSAVAVSIAVAVSEWPPEPAG